MSHLTYVLEVNMMKLERGMLNTYREWLKENVGVVSEDWDVIWNPARNLMLVYFFKREADKTMFLLKFGAK